MRNLLMNDAGKTQVDKLLIPTLFASEPQIEVFNSGFPNVISRRLFLHIQKFLLLKLITQVMS